MLELLFIPFAIVFIAVQLSDRRYLRISFAILTLIAIAAGGIMLRVAHSYGRSYITLAVDDLAKKAPPDQRERLITAAKEFRREFQKESALSTAASSRLWSAIKQVNYSKSKEGEVGASDGDKLPN
jgi:hypothetical protein